MGLSILSVDGDIHHISHSVVGNKMRLAQWPREYKTNRPCPNYISGKDNEFHCVLLRRLLQPWPMHIRLPGAIWTKIGRKAAETITVAWNDEDWRILYRHGHGMCVYLHSHGHRNYISGQRCKGTIYRCDWSEYWPPEVTVNVPGLNMPSNG